jgi:mRNA interferase MazF
MTDIKQFDLWIADLSPGKGNIPGKVRPVLILQTDLLNKVSHPTTVVCPLRSDLSKDSKILRLNIVATKTNGLEKDSSVVIDQMRAIENTKLVHYIGSLEKQYHQTLKSSIINILDLI